MAQVNIGAIKFNWKGPYNNSTAYVVDDVVSSGGSSYVCIQASTGNAVSNGTYWQIMSSAGTNGNDADLLNIGSTAQGDLYYNSGSAIARLAAGTSGQYLKTQGASANPVWGTITTKFVNATFLEITGRATTSSSSGAQTVFGNMGSFAKQYDASTSNIFYTAHFPTVNHGNDCSYHDLKCTHSDSTVVNNYAHLYYHSNDTSFNAVQAGSGKLNGLKAGTWTMGLFLQSNGVSSNGGHTYNPNSTSDNARNTPANLQKSRVTLFEILI
ncbi:hypothetical protein OAO03_02075 [Candidatus Pelagibacter ubique]|nr:hypothetical protein [Candidatus Pelagibacter ubique]